MEWKNEPDRKPLIIRGARQVGKTHLIERFGASEFTHCLKINFEKISPYRGLFESHESVGTLVAELELLSKLPIGKGKVLVFLDEIQACPKALQMLRYFYEEQAQIPVIAAGSLLELVLDKTTASFPVGRVTMRYLYPLTFQEFLSAHGELQLLDYLAKISPADIISDPIHDRLRRLLKDYLILGGMPKVLKTYFQRKNLLKADNEKEDLIQTYRDDFQKYARRVNTDYLSSLLKTSAEKIGQKIHYTDLGLPSSIQAQQSLRLLEKALLVYQVRQLQQVSLPMIAKKKSSPKLVFLDLGLAQHMNGISEEILTSTNLSTLYKGGIAEQLVGQTLLTMNPRKHPELFYWQTASRNGNGDAEVDFVLPYKSQLLPVEVKYGKGSTLASLHQFMDQNKSPLAIRIFDGHLNFQTIHATLSQNKKKIEYPLLSVPLYLIHELPRLITWALQSPDTLKSPSARA